MSFHRKSTKVLHCYPNFSAEKTIEILKLLYIHTFCLDVWHKSWKHSVFNHFRTLKDMIPPQRDLWSTSQDHKEIFHDVSGPGTTLRHSSQPAPAELTPASGELWEETATGLHQAHHDKFNLTTSLKQTDTDWVPPGLVFMSQGGGIFICQHSELCLRIPTAG